MGARCWCHCQFRQKNGSVAGLGALGPATEDVVVSRDTADALLFALEQHYCKSTLMRLLMLTSKCRGMHTRNDARERLSQIHHKLAQLENRVVTLSRKTASGHDHGAEGDIQAIEE